MKKEEILEASKRENKKKDIYEIEIEAKGCNIACMCMLVLACFYFIYEIVTGKGQNPAFYSIIALYNAILYSYKAIKIEKRRKFHAFTGIVWTILTVTLVVTYFTGK